MISAWWLLAAGFAGAMFGILMAALCIAGRKGHDD